MRDQSSNIYRGRQRDEEGIQSQFTASGSRGRVDQATCVIKASASSGLDGGAFSSEGVAAQHIGNIKHFMSDDEQAPSQSEPPPTEAASTTPSKKRDAAESSEPASSTKGGKKAKTKKEPWFDRDGAVASALRTHTPQSPPP